MQSIIITVTRRWMPLSAQFSAGCFICTIWLIITTNLCFLFTLPFASEKLGLNKLSPVLTFPSCVTLREWHNVSLSHFHHPKVWMLWGSNVFGTEYMLNKSLLLYFNFYYGPKLTLFAPGYFNFPLFSKEWKRIWQQNKYWKVLEFSLNTYAFHLGIW